MKRFFLTMVTSAGLLLGACGLGAPVLAQTCEPISAAIESAKAVKELQHFVISEPRDIAALEKALRKMTQGAAGLEDGVSEVHFFYAEEIGRTFVMEVANGCIVYQTVAQGNAFEVVMKNIREILDGTGV